MKKLIIAVMMLIPLWSYAEINWPKAPSPDKVPMRLTVGGAFDLGSDVDSKNCFNDIELNLNYYVWIFKFQMYVKNTCWFVIDPPAGSGYPFRHIYQYGGRVKIWGFFIDVNHFCNHPVSSIGPDKTELVYFHEGKEEKTYINMNRNWYSNFWVESITSIKIGYEFEFNLFKNNW